MWRIGNVEVPNPESVRFAFGKVTQRTRELYDDVHGNFVDAPLEMALHTSVAVDLHLQVCAIAPKATVAQQIQRIASNLERLLNISKCAHEGKLEFQLTAISEPSQFVDLLRNAARIASFDITFSPPNPFDVENQFHKPVESFALAAQAKSGKLSVRGPDLTRDVLIDLSRSAASSGESASAKIQSNEESKPMLRRLSGNQATVEVNDMENIWQKIRAAYNSIRGPK